jgi:hypothetical protein
VSVFDTEVRRRKQTLSRMGVLVVLTFTFGAVTSDAFALTPWSALGKTGTVYLLTNPNTGVTPQVACAWPDSPIRARLHVPGFSVNRAVGYHGRQEIYTRYQIRVWNGSGWVVDKRSDWKRKIIGRYQKRTDWSGITFAVARGYSYSVWIKVVWAARPADPLWIGGKMSYMEGFDFSLRTNGTPLNPITVSQTNGVGWCYFSPAPPSQLSGLRR